MSDDSVLDDLFSGCALTAFLEVWRQTGQFPPNSEATRRLRFVMLLGTDQQLAPD